MTTVGYGDRYPTTPTGRVVAVGLMIGGIAILGTVTAALASWLVEHVDDAKAAETETLNDQIRELTRPGPEPDSTARRTGPTAAGDTDEHARLRFRSWISRGHLPVNRARNMRSLPRFGGCHGVGVGGGGMTG